MQNNKIIGKLFEHLKRETTQTNLSKVTKFPVYESNTEINWTVNFILLQHNATCPQQHLLLSLMIT